MISPDVKNAAVELLKTYSVAQVCELFEGICSPSTLYRWQLESIPNLDIIIDSSKLDTIFQHIRALSGRYDAIPRNNEIILHFQKHFYKKERDLFCDPQIRIKLAKNRLKYTNKPLNLLTPREILRGFKISGIHVGFSHFSPLWIKAFIEEFGVKSLYDPCGGWGHRLLGASSIQYIYNDIWKDSVKGVEAIARRFNLKVPIYNNDSSTFIPVEDYEAVFTCPPYFNVEIYDDTPFASIDMYKLWWQNTLKCAVKPSVKYIGFVINTKYQSVLESICDAFLEFKKVRIQVVGSLQMQSHFSRVHKQPRYEVLCIYKRIVSTE